MDYSDLTYLAVVPSLYSVLEPTLAIILACVPLLRPLFGGQYSMKGTLLRRHVPTTIRNPGANSSAARNLRKTNRVGFRTLYDTQLDGHDASSQVELQPIETKYGTEALVTTHEAGQGDNQSTGTLDIENAGGHVGGGIVVRQEWEVQANARILD